MISCIGKDSDRDDFYFNGNFSNCHNTQSIQCSLEKYADNYIFAISDSMGIDNDDTIGISAIKEIKKFHESIKRQQFSLEYIAEKISESVQLTSNLIYSKSAISSNEDSSILTGFSSVIIDNNRAAVMNLGNNGAYLYRHGERIDVFEKNDSRKNQKLKMLGISPNPTDLYNDTEKILKLAEEESKTKVKISSSIQLEEGDIFIICSDGLLNSVSRNRIESVIVSGLDSSKMASILYQEAIKNGVEDSLTIMIIKVDEIRDNVYSPSNYRQLNQTDYDNEIDDIKPYKEKNIVNYILAFVCVLVIAGVLFMAYLIIDNSNILVSEKEAAGNSQPITTTADSTSTSTGDFANSNADNSSTNASDSTAETNNSDKNNDNINQTDKTQTDKDVTGTNQDNDNQSSNNNETDSNDGKSDNSSSNSNEEYDVHVVQSGETLSSISYKYYNDYNKYDVIIKFNNMKDANSLYVNQELKIPKLNK